MRLRKQLVFIGTVSIFFLIAPVLPAAPTDLLGQAKKLEADKQFDQALAAYQEAVRRQPDSGEALFHLGNLYYRLGRYEESIATLQRAAKNDDRPETHAALGQSYTALEDWDKATEQYKAALARNPKLWDVYEPLADAYLAKKDPEKAVATLRKSLEGPGDHTFSRYKLGLVLMKMNEFDQAAEEFDRVVTSMPNYYMAHFYKGMILGRQGQDEAAEKEFQKAIEINPNLGIAYFELATLYDRIQKTKEAIQFYKKSIEIAPYIGDGESRLAELYYRLERYDDAIPLYEASLKEGTETFMIQFRLGEIYQKKNMPERAIGYYRKALEAFPILFSARYSLGISLMQIKRYDEAAKELSEVIRLNPNFFAAYYQMGVAETRLGRKPEARKHFEEYLRQVPDGDFAQDAQKILKEL